ncbi:hypothetical protein LX99_05061 [Mucilaginibacter oryzae]|uniref:Uncharacterized protein n=2 Tax=Mucilaginibacter oryzae TaxID=468058 RepID=A0A316GUB8_9SPHI|nr:hypothetical protein LX99_05061 [Mucilaginibacter oryzae]
MKKKMNKRSTALARKIFGGTIVAAMLILNVMVVKPTDAKSHLSVGTLKSYAKTFGANLGGSSSLGGSNTDGSSDPSAANKTIEIIKDQELVITKINANTSLTAGLQVGGIISAALNLKLNGAVTAELKNCFSVNCYDGGPSNCTPAPAKVCPIGGCPSVVHGKIVYP